MMKHTQTIFTKYCGRAFSTIASSPLTSSVKGSWKKQDGLALSGAFVVGWASHTLINIYYRREHYYKVDRMLKESDKRSEAAFGRSRQFFLAMNKKWSEKRKSTT